jgi:hypothetical protein
VSITLFSRAACRAHLTSDGHLGGGRAGAVTDALMSSELIPDFFLHFTVFFFAYYAISHSFAENRRKTCRQRIP